MDSVHDSAIHARCTYVSYFIAILSKTLHILRRQFETFTVFLDLLVWLKGSVALPFILFDDRLCCEKVGKRFVLLPLEHCVRDISRWKRFFFNPSRQGLVFSHFFCKPYILSANTVDSTGYSEDTNPTTAKAHRWSVLKLLHVHRPNICGAPSD